MNLSHANRLFPAAALTLNAALAIGWVGGWWIGNGSLPLRAGLLLAGLAAATIAVWLAVGRTANETRAVRRSLDSLCRLEPGQLSQPIAAADLALPAASEWRTPLEKVRASLAASVERAQEAEHQRAALEVRSRRSADQNERVLRILENLSEPVLAIDEYDELTISNKSAERLFELEGQTSDKRALASLVRCEKLVGLLTEIRRRRVPTTRTDEFELVEPEGGSRWYSATVSNIVAESADAGGKRGSQGAVAVLRDISGQKAMQKRNAEFVSSVSHEMKAPLAGITAYVELLADGEAEDEQTRDEFLGVIQGQAERLRRLVDNLLNLARIEAGVVKVHKLEMPLNQVLEEALDVVQPTAADKRIQLHAELSQLYLGALIDRDMLLQAAINLLSNAIKYTPQGGRVTLKSRLVDRDVQFSVEDTGVGLSPADCEKVFDKYYRVEKDQKMAQGTGLGLPLAKHIVEDVHGGTIAVESALGVGSTFTVTLPCAAQLSRVN